jgi:hypothetical protein
VHSKGGDDLGFSNRHQLAEFRGFDVLALPNGFGVGSKTLGTLSGTWMLPPSKRARVWRIARSTDGVSLRLGVPDVRLDSVVGREDEGGDQGGQECDNEWDVRQDRRRRQVGGRPSSTETN